MKVLISIFLVFQTVPVQALKPCAAELLGLPSRSVKPVSPRLRNVRPPSDVYADSDFTYAPSPADVVVRPNETRPAFIILAPKNRPPQVGQLKKLSPSRPASFTESLGIVLPYLQKNVLPFLLVKEGDGARVKPAEEIRVIDTVLNNGRLQWNVTSSGNNKPQFILEVFPPQERVGSFFRIAIPLPHAVEKNIPAPWVWVTFEVENFDTLRVVQISPFLDPGGVTGPVERSMLLGSKVRTTSTIILGRDRKPNRVEPLPAARASFPLASRKSVRERWDSLVSELKRNLVRNPFSAQPVPAPRNMFEKVLILAAQITGGVLVALLLLSIRIFLPQIPFTLLWLTGVIGLFNFYMYYGQVFGSFAGKVIALGDNKQTAHFVRDLPKAE